MTKEAQQDRRGLDARRPGYNTLDAAHLMVDAASDKKAADILLLDVRQIAGFADYFVLCSGASDRQIRAIASGIDEALAEVGVEAYKREGAPTDGWVLLDYSDIIVHIFAPEQRAFYDLESLWARGRTVARLI